MLEIGTTYDPRARQAIFNNQPDELGGIWDAAGQWGAAAIQSVLPMLTGQAGASSGGPARGLAAINAFGTQVIQALQQILAAVRANPAILAQALSDAQTLAGYLGNAQYVYQAQRGNDAEALTQFKAQAAAIVQQIQSLAAAATPSTQTGGGQTTTQTVINPATGQPQTIVVPAASSPASGLSISPTTLLLLGGGLALVFLLKK